MEPHNIRLLMLYEFKLKHSAAEATRNINTAFGKDTANERTVRRWFEKFRSGDISLQNEPRGRPERVLCDDDLKAQVEANPSVTVRELAADHGVGIATVSRHLSALGKVKKLDKWVPHDLTERHKLQRLEICTSLNIRQKNCPFLARLITCDEKWILYDNRKRSARWLDAHEKPKHTPKPSLHPRKTMVTVWWNQRGVIHYSFLGVGETINAQYYCQQIDIVQQKLLSSEPALVNRKGVILLHDNARPHVSRVTLQKLKELNFEVLPHPPYSPDLSPTDFHLFKHLDAFLVNKRFVNEEAAKTAFKDFIDSRPKVFFETGIKLLCSRWEKCINADGAYFD